MYTSKFILSALFLAQFFSPAQAKDITTLQTGVEMSRNEMDKARAAHDADMDEVARYKKSVAAEQKKLADAEKKAEISQKAYLDSRAKFDKAESALDAAWKTK